VKKLIIGLLPFCLTFLSTQVASAAANSWKAECSLIDENPNLSYASRHIVAKRKMTLEGVPFDLEFRMQAENEFGGRDFYFSARLSIDSTDLSLVGKKPYICTNGNLNDCFTGEPFKKYTSPFDLDYKKASTSVVIASGKFKSDADYRAIIKRFLSDHDTLIINSSRGSMNLYDSYRASESCRK